MTKPWQFKNTMEALSRMSNYQYQKQALSNPNGPHIWTFIENYLNVFDDTSILDALEAYQPVFGKEADDALRDLYVAANSINDKLPDTVIVELPAMEVVRQKAAVALALIAKTEGGRLSGAELLNR